MGWAGATVFREGQGLYERGSVLSASFDGTFLQGELLVGSRSLEARARVFDDGSCENLCPCRDSRERGIVCAHVIAVGLVLSKRMHRPEDQARKEEEKRKAMRMASLQKNAFLDREVVGRTGPGVSSLHFSLLPKWSTEPILDSVRFRVWLATPAGDMTIPQVLQSGRRVTMTEKDEAVLFVLEDAVEGALGDEVTLSADDFINLLKLMPGRELREDRIRTPWIINAAPMSSRLLIDLDRENGELLVMLQTELPHLRPGQVPVYILGRKEGWAAAAGHFWPLSKILPGPLRDLYREPINVPREAVPRFLRTEWPHLQSLLPVASDLSEDLFTIEPGEPVFHLEIQGSPASLAATLYAQYGSSRTLAGAGDGDWDYASPDPEDLLRYQVRNPPAEQEALKLLAGAGFFGKQGDVLEPLVGLGKVRNFIGRDWPALRRRGWKVSIEGPVLALCEGAHYITPVVNLDGAGHGDRATLGLTCEREDGQQVGLTEVLRAAGRGESFLEFGDDVWFFDAEAMQILAQLLDECGQKLPGKDHRYEVGQVHLPYLTQVMDALDGVDVESPPEWMAFSRQMNRETRLEPVPIDSRLEAILRPYQKDGVYWLTFLERAGYGGILADEMGLGKTLQTLAWLQRPRVHEEARGLPALIVCPTSLVENWAEEAARFTPGLKVEVVSGADRHDRWDALPEADLVVTSYALVRRDIERYEAMEFAVAALDEAQHIKNRSTQNALAVKRLHARHRLVLSGTPIENSVSDLWSIMDFLMPGYLGPHDRFRKTIELPIAAGEQPARDAQAVLRKKLHPFLLRRLKRDVAKDLPPKIERVAHCQLTPDQEKVYRALIEASRRKIQDMVGQQGFNRSRMEILKTLLRLRQACCHLDLLQLKDQNFKEPSGKMDLFLELLDEAMDAGHRVLVFSQFVSMLTLLRDALEKREVRYCYLDGSTKERLKEVHTFNTDRKIPVFLISLKAGGTGLNLTGADMVIHMDPWWNPAVENQATDRAYRIGQKKTVYSIKLITKGTVEEKVLAMQKRKQLVIDASLERDDEQVLDKLSWEDVQDLLSL